MIDYIDDFLEQLQFYSLVEYCLMSPYRFGETDGPNTPPTGMISDISQDEQIYSFLDNEVKLKVDAVKDLNLYAMYINYFTPGENPYFHTDHDTGITCLYYLGPVKALTQRWTTPPYHVNEGGETQFILDDKSINILPMPNRLSFFDANILHRATSFRTYSRFTIALKYR